jgi:hypothetical protein
MGHENILKNGAWLGKLPGLAARRHQTGFLNQSASLAVSQAGRREIWPDLVNAIANDRLNIEPVSFGQCDCLARFDLRRKTRQHDYRRSKK